MEQHVPLICTFFRRPQQPPRDRPLNIFYGEGWSAFIFGKKHLVFLEHDEESPPDTE